MDGSAWIGFSILIAVILLLGYVRKASTAHSRRINKLFDRIVKEKQLSLTDKVGWDAGIIGVDREKNAIVFVHQQKQELEHRFLYLTGIESAKVVHERNPNSTRILLTLSFADAQMPVFPICFYDSSVDILASLPELKEKAEKIAATLQEIILKKQNK